ncbi:hypothetical protein MIND_00440100 [Mycena indigotica]|uniref:Uncharacterized protein n=1 Tax=Mycena indigotica TaxID=2126181 RepID=A0A8H6SWC3_9AGAR|nr:uncharacterized protein MIND_00440100 [Mycena indigotica]KAF7306488.1 hypothetical protein MIND_00440100 [Mycena indigotica]
MLVQSLAALLLPALLSTAFPVDVAGDGDVHAEINTLGYLKCTATTSSGKSKVIGYVSRALNSYGEYIGVSPSNNKDDVAARMLVSIDLSLAENGTAQSLLVKNAPKNNYPFLGGIGGQEGSSIGSDGDYLLVGGTRETATGAKPSYCGNTFTDARNILRKCSSAIWLFNTTSGLVTPQWVNDDGTAVVANIGYTQGAFVFTGDKKTFEDTWNQDVDWITLSLDN